MKQLYDVLLGVDHAARDTGKRIRMQVRESDPLSAAITAERLADRKLKDNGISYTHAMRVRPVRPFPSAATEKLPRLPAFTLPLAA